MSRYPCTFSFREFWRDPVFGRHLRNNPWECHGSCLKGLVNLSPNPLDLTSEASVLLFLRILVYLVIYDSG